MDKYKCVLIYFISFIIVMFLGLVGGCVEEVMNVWSFYCWF